MGGNMLIYRFTRLFIEKRNKKDEVWEFFVGVEFHCTDDRIIV